MATNRRRAYTLAGLGAQAAGFRSIGYGLRAYGMLGSGGGGAAAGDAASTGLTSLGLSATGVGVALAGLIVTAKLVEVGFNAVAKTASDVVGAIAQIGGARGLQGMIVESATSERMAADIAANSADRAEAKDVLSVLKNISNNTEFSKEDIGTMARSFLGKRGSFGEFKELGDFTANLASVGTLTPQQAGAIVGQLRVQFPEMSMEDTKEAAMSLWSGGKKGAVELKDTESITQVLGFARAVSRDLLAGLNLEMGMTQLAQRFTGGQSSAQAVTGVRRVQEQMLLPSSEHKAAQMRGFFGQDYLAHDEMGRAVLRDAPRDMAKLAYGAFSGQKSLEGVFETRGLKAIRGWVEGDVAQKFAGKSEKERVDILEETFRKMEESGSHLEEFNGALHVVQDTAEYQLKHSFNELANELEDAFLPIVKNDLVPAIKNLSQYLISHKEDFGEVLKSMIVGSKDVVAALRPLATIVIDVAKVFAKIFQIFGWLVGVSIPAKDLEKLMNLDFSKINAQNQKAVDNMFMFNVVEDAKQHPWNAVETNDKDKTYKNLPGQSPSPGGAATTDMARVLEGVRKNIEESNRHLNDINRKTIPARPQPPSASPHGK